MAIRFLEAEVFGICEEKVSRGLLFDFFFTQKHTKEIILLNDENGMFSGIITYESFVEHMADFKKAIQREYVYFDDLIWEKARKIIQSNVAVKLLPVLDNSGIISYFCYNDKRADYSLIDINVAERNIGLKEFQEQFPNIHLVELYNMNEISYKLWKYFERIGVSVKTIGEKWNLVKCLKKEDVESCYLEYQVMRIYSEGTQSILFPKEHYNSHSDISSCFACIEEFVTKQSILDLKKRIGELREKNVSINTIHVPKYEELSNHTEVEELRHYVLMGGFNGKTLKEKYYKDVFGEDLYEWNREGGTLLRPSLFSNYSFKLQNEKNKYANVIMGKRVTVDAPEKYENIIHIFGPCIIVGSYVTDKDTIPNLIQNLINEVCKKGVSRYSIVNHGKGFHNYYGILDEIKSLSLNENDIILIANTFDKKLMVADYSLIDLYNKRPRDKPWFSDIPIHTNALANKAIAKDITKNCLEPLIESLDWSKQQMTLIEGEGACLPHLEVTDELEDYLNMLKSNKYPIDWNTEKKIQEVGAIVMNCNPFTLGHKYLIEKALEKVAYLYIFVVEEDKSQFLFEDRVEMVKQGVSQFKNVKVIPSGKYILSTITMPEYFVKESNQDAIVDATEDIGIFTEYIAPLLEISIRFVGEEPFDKITRQYNEEMKRSLPPKGVDVIEIPRLEVGNNIVSAGVVRKMLKKGNTETVRKLLPDSTFNYLKDHGGRMNIGLI